MGFTETEYMEFLDAAFPKSILKGILLGVIDGYKAAPLACKKTLDQPDRHDALGMIRRGKIHEQLRGVADLHKLEKKDECNSNGSHFFLSVFSGRYRLIANLVWGKKHMVRPAKIRRLWAKHNRDSQGHLFLPAKPEPDDTILLAVLIHGPRGRHRDKPAFVDIVVPDRHFSKYMCRIDLLKAFPEIAAALWRKPETVRKRPIERRRAKPETA